MPSRKDPIGPKQIQVMLMKHDQPIVKCTTVMTCFLLLTCCASLNSSSTLFENLADREKVVIYLDRYKLDSVPKEIVKFKRVKSLTIAKDSTYGWTVYPPAHALKEIIKEPPFRYLPDEITELSSLHFLDLSGLDLKTLPHNFDKLQNLDSLDLTLNKLVIADELDKLIKLKRLKYLAIFGNDVDTKDVVALRTHNPSLVIFSGLD